MSQSPTHVAKQIIRIRMGSEAFESSPIGSSLRVWRQAQKFFDESAVKIVDEDKTFSITMNAADNIEYIRKWSEFGSVRSYSPENWQQMEAWSQLREEHGKAPHSGEVFFTITGTIEKGRFGWEHAFYVFMQQFYAAMTIACPGSCSFIMSKIDVGKSTFEPPILFGDIFESSRNEAHKNKWPVVEVLPFRKSWNWLHEEHFYSVDLGETAWHKTVFALLRAGENGALNSEITVLSIAQALEALFVDGKENVTSLLRDRLSLVLGESKQHKNWITKFYSLRSAIAHGRAAIVRPGSNFYKDSSAIQSKWEEERQIVSLAQAVLLSLLQDLVRNNSREYNFVQKVVRKRG